MTAENVFDLPAWPYPRWVAHRGAGKLAPENTLSAFRLGASHGYRMFECDVKLSADGVPFLLHDATLTRTTSASNQALAQVESARVAIKDVANEAIAGNHSWSTLSQLDAGSWHSRAYAGETIPTLEAIAQYCIRNGYLLNIEIKPTPGTERHTGEVVARHAARLWAGQAVPPLLTSFNPEALEGALATQPELPLPTEEDLHAVEQGGDIKAFMVDKVSTELKNKAFKALFSRPEFNVMDGLDIYIDDYSKFTPLSQEDIGKMTLSKQLLSRPDLEIPKKGDINAGLEKLESALASEEDSASDALDKTEMPAQVSAVEADNPNETRVIPDSLQGVDFNDELKKRSFESPEEK